MSRAAEEVRVFFLTKMSDASIAMTLGRSEKWVAAQRAAYLAEAAPTPEPPALGSKIEPPADPEPPAPAVIERPRPTVSPARRVASDGKIEMRRLKVVSPDIARWAGHFAEARWPLIEVARLFDVDPDELDQKIPPRRSEP